MLTPDDIAGPDGKPSETTATPVFGVKDLWLPRPVKCRSRLLSQLRLTTGRSRRTSFSDEDEVIAGDSTCCHVLKMHPEAVPVPVTPKAKVPMSLAGRSLRKAL